MSPTFRIAIIVGMFSVVSTAAEPGPPPREIRSDRNGYPLPPGAVARLGVPPQLNGKTCDIAWTADGKQFVAADRLSITRFDAAMGRQIETWNESAIASPESFAALSRDGRSLFRLTGDQFVVTDTATGNAISKGRLPPPLQGPKRTDQVMHSFSLSADGQILAGVLPVHGYSHCVAWRFDLAKRSYSKIAERSDIAEARLSPDGKRAFGITRTNEFGLVGWDLVAGREMWSVSLDGRPGGLQAVSADGRRVAVGGGGKVRVFAGDSGKELLTIPYGAWVFDAEWGINFSPDGRLLAVATPEKPEVIVWDVESGREKQRFSHASRHVVFSPDGKSLLTAGHWVQRWDLETGKPMYPEPITTTQLWPSTNLQWSRDGKRLFAGWIPRNCERLDRNMSLLTAWDVPAMNCIWQQSDLPVMRGAVLSDDGETVVTLARDRLRTWRLGVRQELSPVIAKSALTPDRQIALIAYTPDRRLVGFYPSVTGYSIEWLDNSGPRVARKVDVPQMPNNEIAKSVTGRGSFMMSPFWQRRDLTTGRMMPPLDTSPGGPDNADSPRRLMPFGDALIAGFADVRDTLEWRIWETTTGARIGGVAGDNLHRVQWSGIVLSPVGRQVALAGADRLVVRDLAGKSTDRILPLSEASALAFSPDGRLLATALPDSTILIWEVAPTRLPDWPASESDQLWRDLSEDAARAWQTLWRLLDHPDRATDLLAARLNPVPATKDTPDLIARLDDPKFPVRESAARELARRGESIEADLQAAIKTPRSEEQRKRLEDLLTKLDPTVPPTGDVLRSLRCIWLLEQIGTPAARKVLEKMAGGAVGSRVTGEARVAIERFPATRK